jgi:hypothetical protein
MRPVISYTVPDGPRPTGREDDFRGMTFPHVTVGTLVKAC